MSTTDISETPDGSQPNVTALGKIGIIGIGAVGGALARTLSAAGYEVAAITTRHPDRAEALAAQIPGCRVLATPEEVAAASSLIMLAVPDDAITPLAARIPWATGQWVVHLSGAIGARALAPAAERGAIVAALHPLMTFTRGLADSPIEEILAQQHDSVWALETTGGALREALQTMVTTLGGRVTLLDEDDRIPYHISGVLASNYVVTLLSAAVGLWESFSEDAALAREALLPLLRAAVENLAAMDPPNALSGPIARGDLGTLRAHLDWLASMAPGNAEAAALRDAYISLARLTVPLAEAKGTLPPGHADAIRALIDKAQKAR